MKISRRTVLRGVFQGTTVAVSLPYLNCFLNNNGTALAATGAPLPVRFGTWFWGLGMTPERWNPTKVGRDYDLLPELRGIAPYKDKISIFSGFDVLTDGKPNFPHATAGPSFRSGMAPTSGGALLGPSFDTIVADTIGTDTRFRTLDVSGIGDSRNTQSGTKTGQMNPVETSAARFYQRIFGDGFTDPNGAAFTPDPITMARKSVLSVVNDERLALEKMLGASDRARLDQYFTALRQVEGQLALRLQKPEPLVACKVPTAPKEKEVVNLIDDVKENHEIMVRLLAMAVACNQTKVFNVAFNNGASSLTRLGSSRTHHQLTHDEPVDATVGYQIEATWFVEEIMKQWATFVSIFDSMPEGDGTLLDNVLVVAHSETELAKNHNILNLPIMMAGRAGGRVHTGLSVHGKGEPVSRIALTAMQAMGVPIDSFGTNAMQTRKPVGEIVV